MDSDFTETTRQAILRPETDTGRGTDMNIIEVEELTKNYGKLTAQAAGN